MRNTQPSDSHTDTHIAFILILLQCNASGCLATVSVINDHYYCNGFDNIENK